MSDDLRARAKAILASRPAPDEGLGSATARVVEELRIHQIELELQNEELVDSRTKVERALACANETFELAPAAFLKIDRARTIAAANQAALRLFGGESKTIVGAHLADLVQPGARADVETKLDLVFGGTARPAWECTLADGAGSRPVQLEATRSGDGDDCFLIVVDLAPQRRAEAERTLFRGRLAAAEKLESIGRLAGGVAHELNSLLAVIMSYSEMLRDDLAVGDPKGADLEEIRIAAGRAADLTHKLLAFGQRQILRPERVQLDALVGSLASTLQSMLGAHVKLAFTTTPSLRPIFVDPAKLEEAIVNLCVNARDSMANGGTLVVETANTDDAIGGGVLLRLTDSGVGMDADALALAFEPFFTTRAFGQAPGLGLAMVRGIVEQSGGTIRGESVVGRGTSFTLVFPQDPTPVASDPPDATARISHPGGTETILVVDDERQIRTLVAAILSRAGYLVLQAEDGAAALQRCEDHGTRIDLVLSDVVMPVMGGLELVGALSSAYPRTKVLLMSGSSQSQIGTDIALIEKPFVPDELLAKLRAMLDGA